MVATRRRAVAAAAVVAIVVGMAACARRADEGALPTDARPLRIFAAASLASVLDGMESNARYSYAGSSTLARQIDAGASADVFVSANPAWMNWLEERGRIVPASRRVGPGNSLVVVAPRGAAFSWSPDSATALPDAFTGRLALADPSHVPAGIYAKQALEHAGWWAALDRRVVATLDVRAALTLVERGECAAGIVYASDASSSSRCEIVALVPEAWHPPIRYVAAIVVGADTTGARAWLDVFESPATARILQAHGFRAAAPVALPPASPATDGTP